MKVRQKMRCFLITVFTEVFRHGPRLKGKKKELEEDENSPRHSAKRPKMSTETDVRRLFIYIYQAITYF